MHANQTPNYEFQHSSHTNYDQVSNSSNKQHSLSKNSRDTIPGKQPKIVSMANRNSFSQQNQP